MFDCCCCFGPVARQYNMQGAYHIANLSPHEQGARKRKRKRPGAYDPLSGMPLVTLRTPTRSHPFDVLPCPNSISLGTKPVTHGSSGGTYDVNTAHGFYLSSGSLLQFSLNQ